MKRVYLTSGITTDRTSLRRRLWRTPWHFYYGYFKYGYNLCCVINFCLLRLCDLPPHATMCAALGDDKMPAGVESHVRCVACRVSLLGRIL